MSSGSPVAIIPARGGSKGVPRKNVRPLAGKPLLVHTVEQAQRARCIGTVLVSTDDDEIAAVARRAGAAVVARPVELAGDGTATLPVLQHALAQLPEAPSPRKVVTLQPTSPLRRPAHVDEAVERLSDACDAVVSVCPVAHHPHKMFTLGADGALHTFVQGADPGTPRQELPPVYRENGAVYATWARTLLQDGSIRGARTEALVMNEEDSVDIDTPLDFRVAELLLAERKRASSASV